MQDRYTADIGDFGKYGLLRWIFMKLPQYRLGVLWYRTDPKDNRSDNTRKDGRILGYLNECSEYKTCDAWLYQFLQGIKKDKDRRSVTTIEQGRVMPDGTRFHSPFLKFSSTSKVPAERREARLRERSNWLSAAISGLAQCDVVFMDPDNGLQVKTLRHWNRGIKYAYYDEAKAFLEEGKSLIIYQHIAFRTACATVQPRLHWFKNNVPNLSAEPLACVFRGSRAFLVIPVGKAGKDVLSRTADIVSNDHWSTHFTEVPFITDCKIASD